MTTIELRVRVPNGFFDTTRYSESPGPTLDAIKRAFSEQFTTNFRFIYDEGSRYDKLGCDIFISSEVPDDLRWNVKPRIKAFKRALGRYFDNIDSPPFRSQRCVILRLQCGGHAMEESMVFKVRQEPPEEDQ